MQRKSVLPIGVSHITGYLNQQEQHLLLEEIRTIISRAPLYTPTMPRTGRRLSVRMSNCGELGWVCDKIGGYRYQKIHPVTGHTWPSIPKSLLDIWQEISTCSHPPEACLINYYDRSAKM